jgi:hypothetical protein
MMGGKDKKRKIYGIKYKQYSLNIECCFFVEKLKYFIWT